MKVIFIIAMSLFLMSCTITVDMEKPQINDFDYKGHHYLVFRVNGNFGQTYLHDPDCSCHKEGN